MNTETLTIDNDIANDPHQLETRIKYLGRKIRELEYANQVALDTASRVVDSLEREEQLELLNKERLVLAQRLLELDRKKEEEKIDKANEKRAEAHKLYTELDEKLNAFYEKAMPELEKLGKEHQEIIKLAEDVRVINARVNYWTKKPTLHYAHLAEPGSLGLLAAQAFFETFAVGTPFIQNDVEDELKRIRDNVWCQ